MVLVRDRFSLLKLKEHHEKKRYKQQEVNKMYQENVNGSVAETDFFFIILLVGEDTCRPAAVEPCDKLPGLFVYLFFWRSIRASRCLSMSALCMLFRASKLLAATELCRRSSEDDVNPPLLFSGKRRAPRPPLAARVW